MFLSSACTSRDNIEKIQVTNQAAGQTREISSHKGMNEISSTIKSAKRMGGVIDIGKPDYVIQMIYSNRESEYFDLHLSRDLSKAGYLLVNEKDTNRASELSAKSSRRLLKLLTSE